MNFGLDQKELICRLGGLDVCLSGTSLVGGWVGSALMLVGDLKAEHLDLTKGGKERGYSTYLASVSMQPWVMGVISVVDLSYPDSTCSLDTCSP